jgi:hypothetical protein
MLVLIARRCLRRRRVTRLSIVIASVALIVLLGRHGQHLRVIPTTLIAAPGVRADLQIPSESVKFFQQHTRTEPARVAGLARNLFAGFATVYGLEVINGANALENRHYRQFAEAAGLVTPGEWIYELPHERLPEWRSIADFLNVRYLAAPGNITFPSEGYREIAAFDLRIFESNHSWPRAFFSSQIGHYSQPDDLVKMIHERAGTGPFAAIQNGQPTPGDMPRTSKDQATPVGIPAHDYRLETNRTSFIIDAPSAGIAVLHETWLPDDFQATLNGVPTEYFRVNHAFKGVVIPKAGTYRIEFSYWPHGFTGALIAGAIGLLLIGATLFATRWLAPADVEAVAVSSVH